MEEAFSRYLAGIHMDTESYDVLDILHDMFETQRTFYGIARFLEGSTRNHVIAAHERNTSSVLQILRLFMDQPAPSMVMNIDLSGNILRNFLEPVPIVPSREQIQAALDSHVNVTNTNCAICQESVACATRIRACGHCFHSHCIGQWLTVNARCPVCRHDIREPLTQSVTTNTNASQGSGVHSNEE